MPNFLTYTRPVHETEHDQYQRVYVLVWILSWAQLLLDPFNAFAHLAINPWPRLSGWVLKHLCP